jgi:hypothetical protein
VLDATRLQCTHPSLGPVAQDMTMVLVAGTLDHTWVQTDYLLI